MYVVYGQNTPPKNSNFFFHEPKRPKLGKKLNQTTLTKSQSKKHPPEHTIYVKRCEHYWRKQLFLYIFWFLVIFGTFLVILQLFYDDEIVEFRVTYAQNDKKHILDQSHFGIG